MPMLNLLPEQRQAIKAILNQWLPHAEVWAYGSRVKGHSHEMSDLDLVIRNPMNLEEPTVSSKLIINKSVIFLTWCS